MGATAAGEVRRQAGTKPTALGRQHTVPGRIDRVLQDQRLTLHGAAATPADQYRRRAHVSKYVRHFVLRLPFLDWPDSDIAIAIACFRLFTFFPDPLRNSPRFFSCMTFLTFLF